MRKRVKFIGFLKEKIPNTSNSLNLSDYIDSSYRFSINSNRDKIIRYLDSGIDLTYFTLWLYDNGSSIGPYTIKSDGTWIWPSYLSYYLKKYNNFKVDNSFFIDIERNDYRVPDIGKEELDYLLHELKNELK